MPCHRAVFKKTQTVWKEFEKSWTRKLQEKVLRIVGWSPRKYRHSQRVMCSSERRLCMKFSETSRKYSSEAVRDAINKHVKDIRVHLYSFLFVQCFGAPEMNQPSWPYFRHGPTFDVRLWRPRTGQKPWLDLCFDDTWLNCVVSPFASDSAYFIPLPLLQLPLWIFFCICLWFCFALLLPLPCVISR